MSRLCTGAWILETHAHADHLSAAQYLKARSGASIAIGEHIRDVQRIFAPVFNAPDISGEGREFDRLVRDGDRLALGGLEIKGVAAPAVGGQGLVRREKASPNGVQMHVVAGGAEVVAAALVDDEGFVAAGEEVAEEFVAAVEAPGISAQKPLHAGDQIGLGRLGDEMKMIGHEAEGVDLPAGFFAGGTKGLQETAAVGVVAEGGFAMVAAAHEVVDGTGELNAQGAGRGECLSTHAPCVNFED